MRQKTFTEEKAASGALAKRTVLALSTIVVAMLLASGVALAATTVFSNSTPMQIADYVHPNPGLADPYPSQINVQNQSETISDVNVELNGFVHSFPDDVAVLLVGPQGQKALLMSDTGGEHYVGLVDPANLTLDDEATNPLPDNEQLTSGTFKPLKGTVSSVSGDFPAPANLPAPAPAGPYATTLSAFDGTDPNGTWKLFVVDDSGGDVGRFSGGWSLEISTGSTDPQPDTTAPKVEGTTPQAGATGIRPAVNVRATFSEDMQPSSIDATTFKLFKKGTTTRLAATVSYDGSTDKATLDPANNLKRGATYKAVVTTEAKDLAGNRLDQNATLSRLQQKQWFFKVRN
jgi:subtilisin-like proprotein convertase family protein